MQGRPVAGAGGPGAPVRGRSAGLLPGAGGLGGRGVPLPAIPYSFVAGHHVFRIQGADGGPDVVRPDPQSLIPSSPSTTSSGSKAPAAGRTWCATPRNPLFLRRRAPRLPGPRRRRQAGRGAPLPAIPYSFVAGHHVFRSQGADGGATPTMMPPGGNIWTMLAWPDGGIWLRGEPGANMAGCGAKRI